MTGEQGQQVLGIADGDGLQQRAYCCYHLGLEPDAMSEGPVVGRDRFGEAGERKPVAVGAHPAILSHWPGRRPTAVAASAQQGGGHVRSVMLICFYAQHYRHA